MPKRISGQIIEAGYDKEQKIDRLVIEVSREQLKELDWSLNYTQVIITKNTE